MAAKTLNRDILKRRRIALEEAGLLGENVPGRQKHIMERLL